MEKFTQGNQQLRDQLAIRRELGADIRIALKDIENLYTLSAHDRIEISKRVDELLATNGDALKREQLISDLQADLHPYFAEKFGGTIQANLILNDIFSHVRVTH